MASVCINSVGVAQFSVFAVLLFASAALTAEIPELAFLFALLFYYMVTQTQYRVQCCSGVYQRILDSTESFPWSKLVICVILGLLLIAATINGIREASFSIAGTIAYLVLHCIGKYQNNQQKASELRCKLTPPALATATQASAHRHAILTESVASEQSKPQVVGGRLRERPATHAHVEQTEITGPDAEVQDIVRAGLPTATDDLVVRQITNHVRKSIITLVPEAVVAGCAVGNLAYVGAQGLKPEVDIMVMVNSEVLTERLKAFYFQASIKDARKQKSMATLLPDVLQKTATRVLSERLTCLKFWRTQLSGPEPKVVLLAPVALGICQYPIRVNFYVNNPYPQRLSSVLAKGNTRCKELVLLVRHWADVRGITNTAKGHLSSYGYSLLVIYFLRCKSEGDLVGKPIVDLFGEMARFYSDWFDRSQSDLVAVCFDVKVEQIMSAECRLFGIPFIEDPFANADNAASNMTADGVARLRKELTRASRILETSPTTLGDLLERWKPEAVGEEY